MPQELITSTYGYNIIYVYSIDDASHHGLLKIGKATANIVPTPFEQLPPNCEILRQAARKRINEQTATAGIAYCLEYVELAHVIDKGQDYHFDDTYVHNVLENSGYKRHTFPSLESTPQEWFEVDDVKIVQKAITAVKEGRSFIDGPINSQKSREIKFRDEQLKAINQTYSFFKTEGKMLWNAKMRFGKTLCALEVVRKCTFHRTLILTHRPAVKSGWFDDMRNIKFEDYLYGSKPGTKGKTGQVQVGEDFQTLVKSNKSYIYFASMQDLRGSWRKNGKVYKNDDVFSTLWDLIIIDEAHEGTTTELANKVIKTLKEKCHRFLYLSGTPYKILDLFKENEIYTWDYVQEQDAKDNWSITHPNEPNPYEGLAKLNIRLYNIGQIFDHYNNSDEDYFNFSEFFRTWNDDDPEEIKAQMPHDAHVGDFVHADDVRCFLDLLCQPDATSYYPFSRPEFKDFFAHTFWMLPGVAAAAALSRMLNEHPFFGNGQFCIVNVAGEGDRLQHIDEDNGEEMEKVEKDCVAKVKNAIKSNPRTITLSCGRLSTGVSIEQWTAVFMLSGSYKTEAAAYLQTIFRAQTPFKHTPGIKRECYAFDFAPDRSLTVIDKYIKEQQRHISASTPQEKRINVDRFMHYCSVIAIEGSRTVEYDARHFMQRVNRVYAEHVIRNGFKDNRLYKNIDRITGKDLEWLKEFQKTISNKGKTTRAKKSDATVDMNSQGFTGENASSASSSKSSSSNTDITVQHTRKPKLSPTEEAQTLMRDILEKIIIRMPLMLFGAAEDIESLTLEKFVDEIDPQSWAEFMPSGLTKALFNKVMEFYNNDVLMASAMSIVDRTRTLDSLNVLQRVKAVAQLLGTFHYPDNEKVLTPWRVVNMHMSNTIGGYDFYDEKHQNELATPRFVCQQGLTHEIFSASNTRLLEINSKSGVYPLWLAYSLYRLKVASSIYGEPQTTKEQNMLWKQVVEQNLFVVCQTPMAQKITQRVLCGFRDDIHVNAVSFNNLVEILRGKDTRKRQNIINKILTPATYGNTKMKEKKLKFSAIVGNPPYHLTNKGNGNGADSLYNYFIDLGHELGDVSTMIHPARFLFNVGKTSKAWNMEFLSNPHNKVISFWPKAADVFPNVDVKGGIAITIYNKNMEYGKIGFFSVHKELHSILAKVKAANEPSFSTIVAPRELYSLTEKLYKDHPEMEDRQSKGHKFSLGANIFDVFPEVFEDDTEKVNKNGKAKIYGRYENQRCFKWINASYITHPNNYTTYKVIIPKSNGSGTLGEVLSTPVVVEPIVGYTDTFLGIGCFKEKYEAIACMKYIKTKFARTMLGTIKVTQDNPSSAWANVPLQSFTKLSDIDWSMSVEDIDKQLCRKYGLTEDEIAFIESKIKPM